MQLTSSYIDKEKYEHIVLSLSEDSFENEEWVDVCGIARMYYEVSSFGRFRAKEDIYYHGQSCRFHKDGELVWNKHQIIPQKTNNVYLSIGLYIPYLLSKDNMYSSVFSHILVSKSFLSKELDDGLVTDHINGNKWDNRLCNLQRISAQENNIKMYINNESNHDENWRKPVICVETNKLYKHLKDACEAANTSASAMINGIKRGNFVSGYHWKYADANRQQIIDSKIPKKQTGVTSQSTWVRCIETNEIMLCTDMARKFGRERSDFIYDAIYYYNGYSSIFDKHFEFVDKDSIDFKSDQIQNYIKNNYSKKDRIIYCVEDNMYFMTTVQAADYYNIHTSTIKEHIIKNKPFQGKYTFQKVV